MFRSHPNAQRTTILRGHSRFNAFFRFSVPVGAGAADLFAAFDAAFSVPAMFESAVDSGEGDVRRSLPSLLEKEDDECDDGRVFAGDDWRGCEGSAGDADFRGEEVEGIVIAFASVGAGGVMVGSEAPASGVSDPDAWNSRGLVRGVACTFVISFAREK